LYSLYGFSGLDKVRHFPIATFWANCSLVSKFSSRMTMRGFVSYMERALLQMLFNRQVITRYTKP
jgi:hypothetical protein